MRRERDSVMIRHYAADAAFAATLMPLHTA